MNWFLVEKKDGSKSLDQFIDFAAFLKWAEEQKQIVLTAPVEHNEPFEIKVL